MHKIERFQEYKYTLLVSSAGVLPSKRIAETFQQERRPPPLQTIARKRILQMEK
jgi:hypothetical protein